MSILTAKQQEELNKAVAQYLVGLADLAGREPPDLDLLHVEPESLPQVIPNYLEKKWSTVLRLQKRIMDLEAEVGSLRSIMDSQPAAVVENGTSKLHWLPLVTKQIFNTLSNQQVTTVAIHPVLPVVVCGCSDGAIVVWNLAVDDLVPEKIIKAHTRAVNKVAWAKLAVDINGTKEYIFASCSSDLSVKVWKGASYKQIRSFLGHEHTVSSVMFSGDPRLLYSVSRDKTVKVWDTVGGNCVKSYIGHSDWVRSLDVSGSNTGTASTSAGASLSSQDFVLTCSNDQSIRLSHAESGTGLSLLIGHGHVVEDVKFLPPHSNKYIDNFLKKNQQRFPSMPTTLAEEPVYTSLGFKYCVSCGRDNSVKLWLLPPPVLKPHRPPLPSAMNNSQGWLLDSFVGHASWVKSLAVHPNGRFIFSAGDDKTIKVWDLEGLAEGKVRCVRKLLGHEGFVNSIDFAPVEKNEKEIEEKMRCIFISGGVDSTVRVWR